ncbi:hypothetical protein [Rubrolithibacter danxiaensis]|uniref:hypothetical protein n=1 Tax=Rubrolithibacter danxiaensis TaxID=3390805 RepID=UPI003BF79E5D
MKSLFKKPAILIILFTLVSSANTFAQNAVDSDLSNLAGSNSGHDHTGMYIFIVLLLVLSVVVAYFGDNKKKERF